MPRNYIPIDKVMAVLRQHPNATTRQLAVILGMRPASLSSRLSKAFQYGRGVDFTRRRVGNRGHEYLWRAE